MSAEKLTARVKELSKKKSNKSCFDCEKRGTNHINMNVHTFICQSCAGALRVLPHKCYSISMYSFKKADVEALEAGGNKRAARRWHAEMPSLESLGIDWNDTTSVTTYLKNVYERKKYYSESKGRRREKSRADSVVSNSEEKQNPPVIPARNNKREEQKVVEAPVVQSFDDMLSALGDLEFTEVTPKQEAPQEQTFDAFSASPEPPADAFAASGNDLSTHAQHLLQHMTQQNWSSAEMKDACAQVLSHIEGGALRRASVNSTVSSSSLLAPSAAPTATSGASFLDSIPNDAFMVPQPSVSPVPMLQPVSSGFMDMAMSAPAAVSSQITAATDDDYNPFDEPEETSAPAAFMGNNQVQNGFGFQNAPASAPTNGNAFGNAMMNENVADPAPKKDLFPELKW